MPNDDFFNYLVATDQLDDFLGYKENDYKNLFNKNVKVTLKNGKIVTGLFSDEFEEENEILVGLIAINKDEIKEIIAI